MTDTADMPCPNRQSFEGASFGAVHLDQTLFFYDKPVIFTARGAAESTWLAVLGDEDDTARTSTWVLIRTTPDEHERLNASDIGGHNIIGREAIMRHGSALVLVTDWVDGAVQSERKASLAEAMDMAIIDSGEPLVPEDGQPRPMTQAEQDAMRLATREAQARMQVELQAEPRYVPKGMG